jgi:biotin-(acetyl-CoA carboxylase) ligase
MDRSLPIYASTATRRGRRGRGWSSRRRRTWHRVLRPALAGALAAVVVLLAVGAERALG